MNAVLFASLAASGLSSGCASDVATTPSETRASSEALVSTGSAPPYSPTPMIWGIAPDPLTVSSLTYMPFPGQTGYVPRAQASQSYDLSTPGTNTVGTTPGYAFGTTPASTDALFSGVASWKQNYSYSGGVQVTTASAPSVLDQAATAAIGMVPTPGGYVLGSLVFGSDNWNYAIPSWASSLLSTLGSPTGPQLQVFPTARARWMASDYEPMSSGSTIDQKVDYSAPTAFADFRDRGARMYCAARTAVAQQNGKESALATHRAAHFSLLGIDVDLLDIDSSVTVQTPQKFDGGAGAQAFAVPLALGSKVSLFKVNGNGFGFGEVRTPVVFVSGDSEMLQQADLGTVTTLGFSCRYGSLGFQCGNFPKSVTDYLQSFQTASTTEGVFVQGSSAFKAYKDFTIVQLGPLYAKAGFGASYAHASTSWGKDGVIHTSPLSLSSTALVPRNGWSGTNVTGVGYHDGAWDFVTTYRLFGGALNSWYLEQDGAVDSTWYPFAALRGPSAPTLSAVDMRAVGDDDKSLAVSDTAGVTFGLKGGLGVSVSDWTFGIEAGGTITANVTATDMIRDGLYATRANATSVPTPAEGITIRPRDVVSLTSDGPLAIAIKISTPKLPIIGSIGWSQTIWSAPQVTLTSSDSDSVGKRPFSESNYFRLGTGGPQIGDTSTNSYGSTQQPSVSSHLPAGLAGSRYTSSSSEFASFPQTVDQCLTDSTPLPAPAPSAPPTGTTFSDPPPISGSLCLSRTYSSAGFIPMQLPASFDMCTAYSASTATPTGACLNTWMQFLCSLPHQQKLATYTDQTTAIFDPSDQTEVDAMNRALTTCANDFQSAGESASFTQDFVQSLVYFVPCDGSASMLPMTGVVTK